jgi:hypothetical protein
VSGGSSTSAAPLIALTAIACVLAAADFVLVARGAIGPFVAMVVGMLALAWRAWLAARAFGPVLANSGVDRGAALARFRRVPVAAGIACLVLGLGVPLFAHWTGFEGSVASVRGRRTIEFASDPALFWFTTAIWYAVSACLLWFGAVFAWSIERLRRDPRLVFESLANAGR